MSKQALVVTIESDDAPEMAKLVADYLASAQSPLREDYAPPGPDEPDGRSDGYEGPFLAGVEVDPLGLAEAYHLVFDLKDAHFGNEEIRMAGYNACASLDIMIRALGGETPQRFDGENRK